MNMSYINRYLKYPIALMRIAVVIINNIYCIPTYLIWITCFLPFKYVYPVFYTKVEGILFSWLLAVVAMWSYSAGYDIIELGDDITPCLKKHTLVLVNHQSTADVPLLMANFNAKLEILPNVMWIMDRLFKYTNFGLVSLIHEDFFISSGRENREASIKTLRDHLEHSYKRQNRKWIMLFPEGGFLRKRRHISQKYAAQNNLPNLEHVTLPRIGAMKAILDVLHKTGGGKEKNYLDYILDITIAYPNGVPLDLPNILCGIREPCNTYMHYRLYKITEVPVEEEESLTTWLYNRYYEKEMILKKYYETGLFDPVKVPAQIIRQDILRLILINLFFITSSYIHYQLFRILLLQYFLISRVYIQVS